MNKSTAMLALALAFGTLGSPTWAFAQGAVGRPADGRLAAAVSERTMTAEVLTVNSAARALTVRSVVSGRVIDSVFSVNESAADALVTLQPGDVVRITYVTPRDQLLARKLVKLIEADRPR
ncbi:MAG TPA: hypothetical protein VJZ73_16155 [Methylomirabilota bacterium]|nr:hypothetical protein [Methylomirabilota bacterium]